MEIEPQDKNISELDLKLQKEKIARLNNDNPESTRLLTEIVEYLYSKQDFGTLFEQLKSLSKKRGQSKKAIIQMVQTQMKHIDEVQIMDLKLKLIETLKEVCDKKIYLEVEYARCCLMMVKFNESSDNIDQAAKIMQEVQVETYGSMDKREKLEFILYQMKIMIKKQDYIRLFIISQKINPKTLEDDNICDLKAQYYAYLITYYNNQNLYLKCVESYKQLFDTLVKHPTYQPDFGFNSTKQNIFENFVIYAVIAENSKEKNEHLLSFQSTYLEYLEQNHLLKQLVGKMLTNELIPSHVQFYEVQNLELFNLPKKDQYWAALRKQLVQNNLFVFQKFYEQITLVRISELIGVQVDEIETELCDQINKNQVVAKINRVTGVVNYKPLYNEKQELNQWSGDLKTLLNMVDHTCNLIKRENEQILA